MYRTIGSEACGCRIVQEETGVRDGGCLILRCPMHEAAPYLLRSVEAFLEGGGNPADTERAARMAYAWATDGTDPQAS